MVKMGPDLSLRDDEAKNLTKEQQSQVEELLSEYVDIFGDPTCHAKVEAQIIEVEPGARPSLQRSYSVSPAKCKIMDEKLDLLLEKGYIEPCTSEWAAPSLLVAKGDTGMEYRLVTDFRKLNKVTIPDRCPLPRIDDILARVRGKPYMTTLDLTNCYWQIRISDESRTYFATAMLRGLFRYT